MPSCRAPLALALRRSKTSWMERWMCSIVAAASLLKTGSGAAHREGGPFWHLGFGFLERRLWIPSDGPWLPWMRTQTRGFHRLARVGSESHARSRAFANSACFPPKKIGFHFRTTFAQRRSVYLRQPNAQVPPPSRPF